MDATFPLSALNDRSAPIDDGAATAAGFPDGANGATLQFTGCNEPLSAQESALRRPGPEIGTVQVGSVLKERFVLEQVIGSGGMGVVFKALDLRKQEAQDKDPYVAVKVLNADFRNNPVSFIALQRETKRAQTLSHPNVVNVYDFDRDGDHVFMTMEYLRGQPLYRFIQRNCRKGLSFKRAWPIILGMGKALAYAHEKNIVHSDFKPGNVFIDDEANHVKILDFGIASVIHKRNEDVTVFDGRELGALTPGYASLEMLQGQAADPRDDVYALACISFELLTGRHPYGTLPADKALELGLQPKSVNGLSRRRWKVLRQGLALRQADRIPSAEIFLEALGRRSPAFPRRAATALLVGSTLAIAFHFIPERLIPYRTIATQPSIDNPNRHAEGLERKPDISSRPASRTLQPDAAVPAEPSVTAPTEKPIPKAPQTNLKHVEISTKADKEPKKSPVPKVANENNHVRVEVPKARVPPKENKKILVKRTPKPNTTRSRPVKIASNPRCRALLHKVTLGDQDSREAYMRDCTK